MLKTGHSFLGRLTPTIAMAGIDTVHYEEDCSECEKLRDDVVLTLHNIVESSEVLLEWSHQWAPCQLAPSKQGFGERV